MVWNAIADTDMLSFICDLLSLWYVPREPSTLPVSLGKGVSRDWRCRALTVLQRLGLASRSRSRGFYPASTGEIHSQLQHY